MHLNFIIMADRRRPNYVLQRRKGYDAFLGEKTTRLVSVKMRKLTWNITFKFLAKNRGKRSINCDPKLSLCGVTRASAYLIFLGYLLSISDVRGQALFFGPLHGPLVLVGGSKILVT